MSATFNMIFTLLSSEGVRTQSEQMDFVLEG